MDRSAKQAEKEKRGLTQSELIYRGRVIQVRLDTLFSSVKRECVEHPGAVAILPITPEGKLLLIKQWRHVIQQIFIEIPAGVLEEGEDPKDCAQRELQEETGFQADLLIPVGGIFVSPGFCNEHIHLFIAQNLSENPLPPDEHEAIDLYPVSLDEALDLIEKGSITDAKTICAILRYAKWKQEKRL